MILIPCWFLRLWYFCFLIRSFILLLNAIFFHSVLLTFWVLLNTIINCYSFSNFFSVIFLISPLNPSYALLYHFSPYAPYVVLSLLSVWQSSAPLTFALRPLQSGRLAPLTLTVCLWMVSLGQRSGNPFLPHADPPNAPIIHSLSSKHLFPLAVPASKASTGWCSTHRKPITKPAGLCVYGCRHRNEHVNERGDGFYVCQYKDKQQHRLTPTLGLKLCYDPIKNPHYRLNVGQVSTVVWISPVVVKQACYQWQLANRGH